MSIADEVRSFWDADSAVYDTVPNHHPSDPAEQAAWSAALANLLPPPPCRVLDCGAGTGFLSLLVARLGHQVTALDLSPGMLSRLRAKADAAGLTIDVVEGPAEAPPAGPFDAVIERHLLWTLPTPAAALRAWREAAPAGRLVLVEGSWGEGDPLEGLRRSARDLLTRLAAPLRTLSGSGSGSPGPDHVHGLVGATGPASHAGASAGGGSGAGAPDGDGTCGGDTRTHGGHHAEYPEEIRRVLPLGSGTTPAELVRLVAEAGWTAPRLVRLRDVEWAATLALPLPERLLGVPARFAIVADGRS